jgi:hypothetical protein
VDVVSAAQARFGRGGRLRVRVRLSGGRLGRRRHADARARRPARWIFGRVHLEGRETRCAPDVEARHAVGTGDAHTGRPDRVVAGKREGPELGGRRDRADT